MQKARAIRHTEWALKDALRQLQADSVVPMNIGYQRDPHIVINTINRDRPGGHVPMLPGSGQCHSKNGSKVLKKIQRKKQRQAARKHVKEQLEYYWEYLQYEEYFYYEEEAFYDEWEDWNEDFQYDDHSYDYDYDPFWDFDLYHDWDHEVNSRHNKESIISDILDSYKYDLMTRKEAVKAIMDLD